ncbi:sulfatase-like hydrolase/transferase [Coraliomargarita parva]|uniref:sulfatase-like hydrolase/transferase n=1 Tax=Coraliomargarita parva TaxID=3014050 RepID=UPI0022B39EFC|nr:sulfatase-like hydrolase/transferase [Coraliomargarita parva]
MALATADTRPNVIYIVSDDHGYNDLGCFGNKYAATLSPNLDALAQEGVKLTQFYVTAPVCSPSRGGILTARYNERFGYENPDLSIGAVMKEGLDPEETLLPRYFKSVGYATACFGKWHVGFAPGSRPVERGFDEFFGIGGGLNDYFVHNNLGNLDMFLGNNPRAPLSVDEYTSDLFADATIDFIERKQDEPFFVYLPFSAPHWAPANLPPRELLPPQAPDADMALYAGEAAGRQGCLAAITAMDRAIGRILDTLEALNLADNTIVIFYGDHGGEIDAYAGGNNDPLRDGKGSLWEGGIRTPGIIRWPAELPAGATVATPLISLDLSRLVIEASGADCAALARGPLDGLDPSEVLKGNATALHDFLAWRFNGHAAIRKGDYKLYGDNVGGGIGGTLQLFDLSADPSETTDLSGSLPSVVSELQDDFNNTWKPAIANDTAL